MKFLFLILICTLCFAVEATTKVATTVDPFKISRGEIVAAEKIVSMVSLAEKGYINLEVLNQVIKDANNSKSFNIFVPWLSDIKKITTLKKATDFIALCQTFKDAKSLPVLETVLDNISGNYCRERTLEAIGREIDSSKQLSDDSLLFIQENLKHYLSKENRKNFSFFLQSQNNKPTIQAKISKEVTLYSVQHEIIPSAEILQDIVINDQMTSLIQEKGFNAITASNVFYAEYGKLIEQAYRTVDGTDAHKAIKQSFEYLKKLL